MRGKARRQAQSVAYFGITPAYAGKRFLSSISLERSEDHPRLCGEKQHMLSPPFYILGSPPPMRGKAAVHPVFPLFWGITPAYAGKRARHLIQLDFFEDHPRLCGEKYTACKVPFVEAGSPPPMRGKDGKRSGVFRQQRITPAYAGKSRWLHASNCKIKDHPRLCGEKKPSWSGQACMAGSPPPMRGKAAVGSATKPVYGITPAYAGKSRRGRCD